jgi:hypothetical protein
VAILPQSWSPSQVEDDRFGRLRAADQDVPIGWWLERLRVADRTGQRGCFAGVADARTTGPAAVRHASASPTLAYCEPHRADGAASEGHLGTAVGGPAG